MADAQASADTASRFPRGLNRHLNQLVERAGIKRPPVFLLDRRAQADDALAFGRVGHYRVSLSLHLVNTWTVGGDRRRFEAVVLHELAHIRNRDVDITFAALVLHRVVLLGVLLPYVVVWAWNWGLFGAALDGRFSELWPGTWRLMMQWSGAFPVLLALQLHLAVRDLMRKRELYADLDAVGWGADRSVWRTAVGAVRTTWRPGSRERLAALARWLAEPWRSTHPSPALRWAALRRDAEPGLYGDVPTDLLTASLLCTLFWAWLDVWFASPREGGPEGMFVGVVSYLMITVVASVYITMARKSVHQGFARPVPAGFRQDRAVPLTVLGIVCVLVLLAIDPLGSHGPGLISRAGPAGAPVTSPHHAPPSVQWPYPASTTSATTQLTLSGPPASFASVTSARTAASGSGTEDRIRRMAGSGTTDDRPSEHRR